MAEDAGAADLISGGYERTPEYGRFCLLLLPRRCEAII